MSSHIIKCKSSWIKTNNNKFITIPKTSDYGKIYEYIKIFLKIDCSIDQDVIAGYLQDWSNMKGNANLLVRPKSNKECSKILYLSHKNNLPITISAGRTNLTGSATPNGGIILSTIYMNTPKIELNINAKSVSAPIGIPLEELRNKILQLSNNSLYYPVDPTSRNDAYVGGTLSCNASGFIPGEKGATRYWTKGIEFVLPNGYYLKAMRGDYISKEGQFILQCDEENWEIPVPKYTRPNLKNASGPFSSPTGKLDFVDFIVGSEGIYGMITSCILGLAEKPANYLELFIPLPNEKNAIRLHNFLYKYFNQDMSKVTALEYFGYNCQKYMRHKEFLFNKEDEVGVYLQIPIYDQSLDSKVKEWATIITEFNSKINLDSIIVLNDSQNWKRFFEARHSIPENALKKTKQLGGVSIITDTIVPYDNFNQYLCLIHNKLKTEKIEYLLFGHLGDCHLHFHLIPSSNQQKKCMEIYDYMVDLSAKLGGVYSAEHGTGKRKRTDFIKCYGSEAYDMVYQTKKALDPHLLLNRGNVIK